MVLDQSNQELIKKIQELEEVVARQKTVEEALRHNEQRFRAAASCTIDLIWEADLVKNTLIWFGDIDGLLGYKQGEFPHTLEAWIGSIHPDDRPRVNKTVENMLMTGEDYNETYYVRRKDGAYLYWEDRGKCVGRETGQYPKWVGAVTDVTEQKRSEKAHREGARMLSTLLGNLPGMAYRCLNDENWTMEFISQGCLALTGYEASDLIGNRTLSYNALINREDRDALWKKIQVTLANRKPFRLVYRISTKSGEQKWVWEQGVGVFSQNGDLLALEGFVTDITQRVNAEDSLKENERVLSTLLGNLPGIAYQCQNDKNWTMQFISEGCRKLTGFEASDLLGNYRLSFNDLIYMDDRRHKWDETQKALTEKRPYRFEYRIRTATGNRKWVWEQGVGVFSENGALKALEGFITDISERKRAEDALRASEKRYRTLLDFVPTPIAVFNMKRQISYLNPVFTEVFGWTLGELKGKGIPFIPGIHQEKDREDYKKLINSKMLPRYESRRLTKDGRILDVVISAVLFYEAEDEPSGILMVLRDITREKRIARNNEAMLRLSMALPEYPDLENLLDYVTHEIKRLLDSEGATVILMDEEKQELYFPGAAYDDAATQIKVKQTRFQMDQLVAGEIIKTGKPLIITDAEEYLKRYPESEGILGYRTRSLLEVPLTSGERTIGVLGSANKKEGTYDDTDLELLSLIATTVSLSIENARYSEDLKEAYRNVTSLNRAKDRVISHLSHELKTPVSVLDLSLNSLERKLGTLEQDNWKGAMGRAQRNLDRIREIQYEVEDIMKEKSYKDQAFISLLLQQCSDLLMGLVDEKNTHEDPRIADAIQKRIHEIYAAREENPVSVFVNEYVAERLASCAPLFGHRQVNILTRLDETPAVCIPLYPLQILTDGLIKNAIENTPDKGKIEISVRKSDGAVLLQIKDYGIGISESNQARIFEGFFATQETLDYSSKNPFDFYAGGKGADLLRMKIFSERYGFDLEMHSSRCIHIPRDEDVCPGNIPDCTHCQNNEDCYGSGGTTFSVVFQPAAPENCAESDPTTTAASQISSPK